MTLTALLAAATATAAVSGGLLAAHTAQRLPAIHRALDYLFGEEP